METPDNTTESDDGEELVFTRDQLVRYSLNIARVMIEAMETLQKDPRADIRFQLVPVPRNEFDDMVDADLAPAIKHMDENPDDLGYTESFS